MAGFLTGIFGKDDVEFILELINRGIIPGIGQLQSKALARVQRMLEYESDSPQFLGEKANLVDALAGADMESLARRAAQGVTTEEVADAGDEQRMLWLGEVDARSCEPCLANSGKIMTLGEWKDQGLPGAETCLGGDRCRCDLFPVDVTE